MTLRALVVDDSPVDMRLVKYALGKRTDTEVIEAHDGDEALQRLEDEHPDLVITDLMMPGIDGLGLVAEIVRRRPGTPVILMTGHGSEDVAAEALRRGAASYVPKGNLRRDLVETIDKVMVAVEPARRKQSLLESLTQAESAFSIESDPALVRSLVGYLQEHLVPLGLADQTGRMRVGIALEEAVLNAIYHGNLELDSALREADGSEFDELAEKRRRDQPYCGRRVHIHAKVTHGQAVYVIRDEGPGFVPSSLPDPTDPERLDKVSGRGLLLIHAFMDEVSFNDKGNEITLIKHAESEPAGA